MVSANWCYLLSFLNLHSLQRFATEWHGIGKEARPRRRFCGGRASCQST